MELGDPQQGDRQAGGEQHLLRGELGAVVAVRAAVDPDDRDVDQVLEPVTVDRLHEPAGAGHVGLPVVAPRVARGVHDDLRPGQRLVQIATGREVTADAARSGAASGHELDLVAGRLERLREPPSEPAGAAGDEYVHALSLANRSRRPPRRGRVPALPHRGAVPPIQVWYLSCEIPSVT